jgi:hypothetical protein
MLLIVGIAGIRDEFDRIRNREEMIPDQQHCLLVSIDIFVAGSVPLEQIHVCYGNNRYEKRQLA